MSSSVQRAGMAASSARAAGLSDLQTGPILVRCATDALLLQIVETDPANSAQWGYHLWLLRCAAAHMKGPDQAAITSRVLNILEESKRQCEQIVASESARMDTLRGRVASVSEGGDPGVHALNCPILTI
jgi:hypothetical protein